MGIGDIHGRFHRVQDWLRALEQRAAAPWTWSSRWATWRPSHARTTTGARPPSGPCPPSSPTTPGGQRLHRPFYFIGGNNEDFESAARASRRRARWRPACTTWAGWAAATSAASAWPGSPASTPQGARDAAARADHRRHPEAGRATSAPRRWSALRHERDVDLLLVHEWPRGLFRRVPGTPVRPWMGNPLTRTVVDAVRRSGSSAGTRTRRWRPPLHHTGRQRTRGGVSRRGDVARGRRCSGWSGRAVRRARGLGWGIDGHASWSLAQPWGASRGAAARRVPLERELEHHLLRSKLGARPHRCLALPLAALAAACSGTTTSNRGSASCTPSCGSGLTCVDNADFPGGICTSACGNGGTCPAGNKCVQLSTGEFCALTCDSGSGCPTGLVCGSAGSAGKVCLAPACVASHRGRAARARRWSGTVGSSTCRRPRDASSPSCRARTPRRRPPAARRSRSGCTRSARPFRSSFRLERPGSR